MKRRVVQKAIKAHGNMVMCAGAEGARNATSHMLPDAACTIAVIPLSARAPLQLQLIISSDGKLMCAGGAC